MQHNYEHDTFISKHNLYHKEKRLSGANTHHNKLNKSTPIWINSHQSGFIHPVLRPRRAGERVIGFHTNSNTMATKTQ